MGTTIDIDNQVLMHAKLQATQQGCTLKQVIEDALRKFFSRHSMESDPVNWQLFPRQTVTRPLHKVVRRIDC